MAELYRDYFDIDPEFFPAVNASVIEQHPNLWEKFYPHETFVKLMRDLISCVGRLQKLSVWVEGEYGTGKSHAVLTLKKLLEADDATTKAYFDRFPEQLGNDLYNKLYSLKHAGNILVAHRYASSDITSETDLLFDVQDSIVAALREKGYKEGDGALRSAAIQWLSDTDNKAYFNGLMKGTYAATFAGDDVDALIKKLQTFEGLPLSEIMTKVMKLANERGIRVLTLTKEVLQDWIRAVIKDNNLYGLIFIWDEFTDFFKNNRTRLSGLQALVEMSEGDFFYLIPVTHNVANLFPAKDKDWNVISHRFVLPFCNIELPDNMAFRLMGKALEKRQDTHLMDEWQETSEELYERTRDARALVKKQAKIQDTELRDVLPLHPYAALLLKNMASYYAGDVRSMFDFLKNDTGDEIRGFKWFIDTFGPADDNPLLTVDLLWDFFYEKGKELLDRDVRKVLDSFGRARNLIGDEPRILKAILLMQAIYEKTGSQVGTLAPSAKNIEYAFMGSDLDDGQPTKIADSLVRKKILYKTPGSNLYSALLSADDDIPPVDVKFSNLLTEGKMQTVIEPKDALKLRYDFTLVADASRLEQQLKGIINQGTDNRIHAVIAFAKSGLDAYELSKAFSTYAHDEHFRSIVFIDATLTPLGDDRFEQISDSKAKYEYWHKKNTDMAGQYNNDVSRVLEDWHKSVKKGEFIFQTVGRNHRLQAVNPLGLPFKEQTWYTEGEVIKMAEYRKGSHTVYDIKYHFVWITKYRYQVLKGDVALRLRELLRQGCEANHIRILKGSVGTDHVHMLLSCPTTLSPSQIMQYLKGRSSRILQDEYPTLKKRYWGQHMWGRGYFCGTVGEVDQKTIEEYIKNQGREEPTDNFTIVP